MNIMNFCKAIALTTVTSLALMHAPARADTVDFNSTLGIPIYPVPSLSSGGFNFAAPMPGDAGGVGIVNGSAPLFGAGNGPMLVFYGDNTSFLTVSQTNGGLFSLSALHVGRWFGLGSEYGYPEASLSITGYTGPGLTGAQVIRAPYALPSNTTFSLLTIDPQYASFSFQSLTFHLSGTAGGYVAVDNLVLTPVPEPETYALLLAGLGLLAVVGRRRKTLG
jgi:hypothetical protein